MAGSARALGLGVLGDLRELEFLYQASSLISLWHAREVHFTADIERNSSMIVKWVLLQVFQGFERRKVVGDHSVRMQRPWLGERSWEPTADQESHSYAISILKVLRS